jgi:hypothetical protein
MVRVPTAISTSLQAGRRLPVCSIVAEKIAVEAGADVVDQSVAVADHQRGLSALTQTPTASLKPEPTSSRSSFDENVS